jgi:hypothetical protein
VGVELVCGIGLDGHVGHLGLGGVAVDEGVEVGVGDIGFEVDRT